MASEKLFIYGTLRETGIQRMVIGRAIQGTPATLEGYRRAWLKTEGESYPVLAREPGSSIRGLVISVTQHELELLDAYEGKAYARRKVALRGGMTAWAYVKR